MTTTPTHLVIGAGAVGRSVTSALNALGHDVVVATRTATPVSGARSMALDATNQVAVIAAAHGAASIINCVNPPYHQWATMWPPIADALLGAAEATGAVLVTMSNLYGYGDTGGAPMSESTPLMTAPGGASHGPVKGRIRAQMWDQALLAHQSGRARVVEARASDFIGAGLGDSAHLGDRVTKRVVAGKPVRVVGKPDQPHTFSFIGDVGRTLAALATNDQAWGRAWHVPSNQARTVAEVVADMAVAAGVGPVKVASLPTAAIRLLGLVSPVIREMPEVLYQFTQPFVMESVAATTELGLAATAWDDVIAAAVGEHLVGA